MSSTEQRRILIVEDDVAVRRLLARHFKRTGFAVVEAGDVGTALAAFPDDSPHYDLVVTDIHLPGDSGVALARYIHDRIPEQPVVFVTGDTNEETARRALEEGAAGYLLKPFQLFELDALVNGVTRGRDVTPETRCNAVELEPVAETSALVRRPERMPVLGENRPVVLLMEAEARRPKHRFPRVQAALAVAVLLVAFLVGAGLAGSGKAGRSVEAQLADMPRTETLVMPVLMGN